MLAMGELLLKMLWWVVGLIKLAFYWLEQHTTFVLMVATVALAIITYWYLTETKEQRLLTEKSVLIDIAPKVFFEGIKGIRQIDEQSDIFKIGVELAVKNCGKTEAINVKFPFVVSSGEKKISEGTKGPFQYIFPSQVIRYGVSFVNTDLTDTLTEAQIELAKKAIKSQKPVHFGEKSPPIQIDITIEYEDIEGKKISTPYSLKYSWHKNMWFFSEMPIDF